MNRKIEWMKIFEVMFFFLVINTGILYLLSFFSMSILWFMYHFTITLFAIQGTLSFIYSISALPKRKFEQPDFAGGVTSPKTTFIVSAYLINEVSVIENTLNNLLLNVKRPAAGIEVILAYNTTNLDPIELKLKEMAFKHPELILANAFRSKSKSENLNYALKIASGEMIVLLDADHIVEPDCLDRAWKWLSNGYDIVQGRCKIRNGSYTPVSKLIEVEFEVIYGVNHFAKSVVFDSTLFGGSNGYWKASVMKKVQFSDKMLTEDIDSTLRAILSGYKIIHDRSIISTEIAPEDLAGLWFQRKRWAQGWYQVSLKYQMDIIKSAHLNFAQKFLWTTLLMWRVFYDIMTHFLFPTAFAYWLRLGYVTLAVNPYILYCIIITLASGPFEAITAYLSASKPRSSFLRYVYFALLTFPYTLFKNTIQVVAIIDETLGRRDWTLSERAKR